MFVKCHVGVVALDVQLLRRSRRLPCDHGILQHTRHVARSALGWHVREKFLFRKSESVVHDLLGRTAGHLRHAFDPRTRFLAPDKNTLRIYGASDYAVTADGGDYTVHVVVGVDPQSRIYLLDVWRKQTSSDQWVESFCDLVRQWEPIGWAEEGGQIKAGIGPFLVRCMRERKAYVHRHEFPTRGDKARRAQSIRGRIALDGLYVPERAPWYAAFRAEMLTFPAGKHDDQVDALGLVGQFLDLMVPGRPAEKPEETQRVGYAANLPRCQARYLGL